MTKKHFEAIAAILLAANFHSEKAVKVIANQLADLFSNENPRFDRKRFLKACGIN